MKYKVKVIETLSRIVEVEAENQDNAWDKVEKMYKEQAIVLDESDFDDCEIYVVGDGNKDE